MVLRGLVSVAVDSLRATARAPACLATLFSLSAPNTKVPQHTACHDDDSWVTGSFHSGFRTAVFITLFLCTLAHTVADVQRWRRWGEV